MVMSKSCCLEERERQFENISREEREGREDVLARFNALGSPEAAMSLY